MHHITLYKYYSPKLQFASIMVCMYLIQSFFLYFCKIELKKNMLVLFPSNLDMHMLNCCVYTYTVVAAYVYILYRLTVTTGAAN